MKTKILIALGLVFVCSATKAEQICQTNESLLGAHYRQVNSQVNTVKNEPLIKDETVKLSSLWRKNQKVLSFNGEQSTTWFRLSNGSVQKTAHFDHFQRSIEYQAKPMSVKRWQQN